jgi:hypothetical protein
MEEKNERTVFMRRGQPQFQARTCCPTGAQNVMICPNPHRNVLCMNKRSCHLVGWSRLAKGLYIPSVGQARGRRQLVCIAPDVIRENEFEQSKDIVPKID